MKRIIYAQRFGGMTKCFHSVHLGNLIPFCPLTFEDSCRVFFSLSFYSFFSNSPLSLPLSYPLPNCSSLLAWKQGCNVIFHLVSSRMEFLEVVLSSGCMWVMRKTVFIKAQKV